MGSRITMDIARADCCARPLLAQRGRGRTGICLVDGDA